MGLARHLVIALLLHLVAHMSVRLGANDVGRDAKAMAVSKNSDVDSGEAVVGKYDDCIKCVEPLFVKVQPTLGIHLSNLLRMLLTGRKFDLRGPFFDRAGPCWETLKGLPSPKSLLVPAGPRRDQLANPEYSGYQSSFPILGPAGPS